MNGLLDEGMKGEEMQRAGAAWFCVRTQSKHEHIAAAWLERELPVEIYLPRIRFQRALVRGPVWFTEALFPNYLFARFILAECVFRIGNVPGVRGIVHFGEHWPSIPDEVIAALRTAVGIDGVRVISEAFRPGDTVQVAGGAFHGLHGVVTRLMPSRARVAVLLDFLGRQTNVELDASALVRTEDERIRVFR